MFYNMLQGLGRFTIYIFFLVYFERAGYVIIDYSNPESVNDFSAAASAEEISAVGNSLQPES